MSSLLSIVIVVQLSGLAAVQKAERPPARYGVEARPEAYPQTTPKETLASIIAAVEQKRLDYVLAHLTDPQFVDRRVKDYYGGSFDELVREARGKFADNPALVKEFERFLKEGEWEGGDGPAATARLKDLKTRLMFFRKIDNRWFLENRQKPEAGQQK